MRSAKVKIVTSVLLADAVFPYIPGGFLAIG
jgi:hypothetical protein